MLLSAADTIATQMYLCRCLLSKIKGTTFTPKAKPKKKIKQTNQKQKQEQNKKKRKENNTKHRPIISEIKQNVQ